MPLSQLFNRVKQTVASAPGAGNVTLGGAASGYRTFATAGVTNGLLVNYLLEDGTSWEYGRGTYSTTGPTLARTSIRGSSNGGAAINASAAAIVSCDAFAEDVTTQFTQFATTGDLSAAPTSNVTFTGLDAYTDLIFDWTRVGHDYTTANQTFSVAFTLDGTNYSAVAVATPSISSGGVLTGQMQILGNSTPNAVLRSDLSTNSLTPPQIATATSNPRILAANASVTGLRITPTTSGNLNKGTIVVFGR